MQLLQSCLLLLAEEQDNAKRQATAVVCFAKKIRAKIVDLECANGDALVYLYV